MTEIKGLPCPSCNKGILIPHRESYSVRVGESRFAKSDEVNFLSCPECGDAVFLGNESVKADTSAARNLLRDVLSGTRKMSGEDVAFVRSVLKLSARELSLRLELDASTVSQWENRKTELSYPVAFSVSMFLFRELMKNDAGFSEEISKIVSSAFNKPAA